jgi:UDP-glucuronate 4-epimerase
MLREFAYINGIVEGVVRCLDKPATPEPGFDALAPDPATGWAPHRLFNNGNAQPQELLEFIALLEQCLGCEAIKQLEPMQPGDVEATAADWALTHCSCAGSPAPVEQPSLGRPPYTDWVA